MRVTGPPDEPTLARLYDELARIGAPAVGRRCRWAYRPKTHEALLTLAADMLRYDARLLSILLEYLLVHGLGLDPRKLREEMRSMQCPHALLVVGEFAKSASSEPELRYFCDYLAAGWARVTPPQRFFLDGHRPGSRMAQRQRAVNLKEYARWGFIGVERPSTSTTQKTRVGSYDATTRATVRRRLAERHAQFSVADYLSAVDHGISRQQAYLDLKNDPEFESTGRGRGARWQRVPPPE